jgi:hypothetical protein
MVDMAVTHIPICQNLEFLAILKTFAALREDLFRQIVDGADDSVTHKRRTEIQEQAELLA